MLHKRANMIKRGELLVDRPGIVEPMMVPTRLTLQNDLGAKTTVDIAPDGKTSVGGVQWLYKIMRPGLAQPAIVAKKDADKAMKKADVAAAAPQIGFWRK